MNMKNNKMKIYLCSSQLRKTNFRIHTFLRYYILQESDLLFHATFYYFWILKFFGSVVFWQPCHWRLTKLEGKFMGLKVSWCLLSAYLTGDTKMKECVHMHKCFLKLSASNTYGRMVGWTDGWIFSISVFKKNKKYGVIWSVK